MANEKYIGTCNNCGIDGLLLTTYKLRPDDDVNLCDYCEQTSQSERHAVDMVRILPRMLRTLEKHLAQSVDDPVVAPMSAEDEKLARKFVGEHQALPLPCFGLDPQGSCVLLVVTGGDGAELGVHMHYGAGEKIPGAIHLARAHVALVSPSAAAALDPETSP